MTLDPAPGEGQGARLHRFLMGPFLDAKGAVNCDLLARRLSRRRLLALRDAMLEGAAMINEMTSGEHKRDTAE